MTLGALVESVDEEAAVQATVGDFLLMKGGLSASYQSIDLWLPLKGSSVLCHDRNQPASKMRVQRFAIREEGYFFILRGPEMGWSG